MDYSKPERTMCAKCDMSLPPWKLGPNKDQWVSRCKWCNTKYIKYFHKVLPKFIESRKV